MKLADVKISETFKIAGIEFIKFNDIDGVTTAVAKDILFNSRFGDNNDFSKSNILKRLEKEVLPKIYNEVGEENVCDIHTDLTTLDGLKPYSPLVSKISLPTFDFYRTNVEIFDKYPVNKWWWLATPDSAKPHYDPIWIVCVSPVGDVGGSSYGSNFGVRPILRFVSSISVSCED